MANLNISFGGNVIIVPSVVYQDIVAPVFNPGQFTLPLVYLGYGYNGAFGASGTFNTPQALLSYIRGGPASGFVQPLCQPSPSLVGSNNITFIQVGSNTAATLTLKNAAASGSLALTTATSGVPSNLTQAEVVPGSLYSAVTSNLTLFDGYSNTILTGNNLGVPFQLAYTGTATGTIVYNTSGSAGNLTAFGVVSPLPGESFSVQINPAAYSTVTQVVEYLNGTGFYAASLISDTVGELQASQLTPATGVVLPPVSGTAWQYVAVSGIPYDAAFWVNQFGASIASAAVVSGTSSTSPLANIPLTHFAGATSTPPTNSSYASGFNLALNLPAWVVFADSNATAVQQLGAQHAELASEPVNGANRRFFTGSSLGDSVTTTLVNAANLNSFTSCYVYPGISIINTITGQNQMQPGLYAAAAAAGIASSNQVALPLTNKPLHGTGVEVQLTISQINQLQIGGVIPIVLGQANGNVPTILSDQTTWQVDNNPLNALTQQVACRWWLAYSMRNALRQYIGQIASPDTLTQILNSAKAALNASIYTPGSNGVLASWDSSSLSVVYTGATQTAAVTAAATTVGQYRFITETVNISLFNATITNT